MEGIGWSVCSRHLDRRWIPFISCLGSLVWLPEDAVQMVCVQRVSLRYQHCCSHIQFTSPCEGLPPPASVTAVYQKGDVNSEKPSKDLATLTWRLYRGLFKLTEIAAFLILLHVTVWPLPGHVITHLSHSYPGVHLFLCRIHLLSSDWCFNFRLLRMVVFHYVVFRARHGEA